MLSVCGAALRHRLMDGMSGGILSERAARTYSELSQATPTNSNVLEEGNTEKTAPQNYRKDLRSALSSLKQLFVEALAEAPQEADKEATKKKVVDAVRDALALSHPDADHTNHLEKIWTDTSNLPNLVMEPLHTALSAHLPPDVAALYALAPKPQRGRRKSASTPNAAAASPSAVRRRSSLIARRSSRTPRSTSSPTDSLYATHL